LPHNPRATRCIGPDHPGVYQHHLARTELILEKTVQEKGGQRHEQRQGMRFRYAPVTPSCETWSPILADDGPPVPKSHSDPVRQNNSPCLPCINEEFVIECISSDYLLIESTSYGVDGSCRLHNAVFICRNT